MKKRLFTKTGRLLLSAFLVSFSAFAQITANFTVSQTTGCIPFTVDFTDKSTGTGINSWKWDFGDGNSSTLQNPVDTYTKSGSYSIKLKISNGTNKDSITKTSFIVVNSGITVTASSINARCNGNDGQAVAIAAGGTGALSYSWSNGVSGYVDTALSKGAYIITVSDVNGCSATSTVDVVTTLPPTVTVQSTSNTCQGKTEGTILVNTTGTILSYNWSNKATGSMISGLSSGSYSVTVTDIYNCIATTAVSIVSLPNPVVNTSRDTVVGGGQSVPLFASGGTTYLWVPSTSLNNPNIYNPVADPLKTTTYTVIVTDANNCSSIDSVKIVVKPTGINGYTSTIHFNVFPNPTSDKLNFVSSESLKSPATLKIMDSDSRLIYQQIIEQKTGACTIDISSFSKGIYYYLFNTDTEIISRGNFIVNK